MIKITKDELNHLEVLGSGKFGKVYKKDNETAYKIYHEKIYEDYTGKEMVNPSLVLSPFHYKALISRSKKLMFSGGICDTIYINGKFGGVSIPYYKGNILSDSFDEPLKLKIELSKQIVRNAKELSSHLIYPTDYKSNNIILENNKIQIIDLDDVRTHISHIPNIIYKLISLNSLSEAIQIFLKQYLHYKVSKEISKQLEREKAFYGTSYKKIEEYLDKKNIERKFVFVNNNSNIEMLKSNSQLHDFKIVYTLDSYLKEKEDLQPLINRIKSIGLDLYDFIETSKIEKYQELENTSETILLDNSEIKKVYSVKH